MLRWFAPVLLIAMVVVLLPAGSLADRAYAVPNGTLTIDDSGSDSLPTPAGGVYDIQSDIRVKPADIEAALSTGPATLWATSITVQSDIDVPNSNTLTLKAAGNIVVGDGVSITSGGGSLIFWADSDSDGDANTSGGHISVGSATISTGTGAGNILFAGGDDANGDGVPDESVYGAIPIDIPDTAIAASGRAGIVFNQSTVIAGSGDVLVRAQSTGIERNYQIGAVLYGSTFSGSAIDIYGTGSRSIVDDSSSNWGVYLAGTAVTGSGDISISGEGGASGERNADSNHWGINMVSAGSNPSSIHATGLGNVLLDGVGGGGALGTHCDNEAGVIVGPSQTISSESGNISVTGQTGYTGQDGGCTSGSGSFWAVYLENTPSSTGGNVSITGRSSASDNPLGVPYGWAAD